MIEIKGGGQLDGSVAIQGSKNAGIAIKAAAMLVGGECTYQNMPDLELKVGALQMGVEYAKSGRIINPEGDRCGYSEGRCVIGCRPLNWHTWGIRKMIKDGCVMLPYPSVGATANIILASVLRHDCVIENYACEPEVMDMIKFLKAAGADIKVRHGNLIYIKPVPELTPVREYKLIPDRNDAATWTMIAKTTNSKIKLSNTDNLIKEEMKWLELDLPAEICTDYYPRGFPTDYQPLITPYLCLQEGVHHIKERVFDNRFHQAIEMQKLGADTKIIGNSSLEITGIKGFKQGKVYTGDVRGAAALVIAGLATKGLVEVHNEHFLLRGYENFVGRLNSIGADIWVN